MKNRSWVHWLPTPIRNILIGRENLQAILANSGWLLFDRIIQVFLGLIVGAWVARYLGPAQYGELAYAITYIAIFQAIVTLGMDGIVVREISQNKSYAAQIVGTCFFMRLITGILCWLIAIISIGFINGWHDRSLWIIAIIGGGLIFQAADTIDLWFQSVSKSKHTVFVKISSRLIINGIKVLLILSNAPMYMFALVITFEALFLAIGLFFVYHKHPINNRWQLIWPQAVCLLRESWPLMISSMSIVFYMRADQIIIKELLGISALGMYAAIQPIAIAVNFIPVIINTSIMPTISRIAKNKKDNTYEKTLIKIFRIYFFSALLIAIPTSLLSENIVNLLFGLEYIEAANILKVYVFASCFTWLGVAHTLWMINEKKTKLRLYGTITSMLVCLVANYFFLEKFGIVSAAWIAIVTQFIAACGINLILAKESFFMQLEAIFFIKVRRI